VHAEHPGALHAPAGGPREYGTWLASRPPAAEAEAIALVIRLAAEYGTRAHIVHLATATALPLVRDARERGVRLTVETCPHYLNFAAEDIAAGDTRFKCAPPLRGADERDALWRALLDGSIDLVATDHSPAPPPLKHLSDGDFVAAWGGIASLQLGLAAVWTAGRARGITPAMLARWMCEAPARLAGLHPQKGELQIGSDADVVIWDPDAEFEVDATHLYHRHPVTPYDRRRLCGRVITTLVRGSVVYSDGIGTASPVGRLL
jgi:allantoinase